MTELAKRYGGSLYELAAEEHLEARLLEELDGAAACIRAEPAYLRLLSTPSIPKKERCALLDEAFQLFFVQAVGGVGAEAAIHEEVDRHPVL